MKSCASDEGSDSFLECLEDIWERDAEEGFIEFAFDPATQRRVHVVLNSLTAAIAGMHKDAEAVQAILDLKVKNGVLQLVGDGPPRYKFSLR